jgi:signal transduction histidine kinase
MKVDQAERSLIFATHGRDAQVAAAILGEAGIASEPCFSISDLVAKLDEGAGFSIVAEETLHRKDLGQLVSWLEKQPEWSDFPFILLTHRGGGLERNPAAERFLKLLGNVSFLERPFHPTTLVSISRAALRARRRQYDASARLLELKEGRAQLAEINEHLEQRVEQRTAELELANAKILEESAQRDLAEEKLRQVQKLEMLGELTGGIAHDFNNLLTAVLGNLSLLRKHLPAVDTKAQRLIDGAVLGAERGAALTQRLLAFARRQSLNATATDVSALVAGMKPLLERSVGPEIHLSFELAPGRHTALIDSNQVELAVLNLAVNARDAMPNGGKLVIGVDQATSAGRSYLPDGRFIRIWVSDTGEGMDGETLRRAIDPFFSTKELGKGTGLGLSMVHGLAVQLGGALRLESAVGEGTCAELYLPATEQPAVASEAEVETSPPEVRRSRILLVDDDALIAMSSVGMLEDLGYEVLEAHSGHQALDMLRNCDTIDLLITDFAMPGMTGAQLIEAAKTIQPDLPVLLSTGYAELPTGKLEGVPRINKPYTQPQLASGIAKVLSGP